MPRKKENTRIETFNKLVRVKKTSEKEILNLKIEDLIDITEDDDVQNIILLRKSIKNRNILDYFDFMKEEANQNGK